MIHTAATYGHRNVMRNIVEKAREDLFRAFRYSFPESSQAKFEFMLEGVSRLPVADSGLKVTGLAKKVDALFAFFTGMNASTPATTTTSHPRRSLFDDFLAKELRFSSPLTDELEVKDTDANSINRRFKFFFPRLHLVLEFYFFLFLSLRHQLSVVEDRISSALRCHGPEKLSNLTEGDELFTEITKGGLTVDLKLQEERAEFIERLQEFLKFESTEGPYCNDLKFTLDDPEIGFSKMASLDYSGPDDVPTRAYKERWEQSQLQHAISEAYEHNIERERHEAEQRKKEKREAETETSEEMDYGGIDGLFKDPLNSTLTSGSSNSPSSPTPADSSEEVSNSNSRAKGSSDALGVKAEVAGLQTVVPPKSGQNLNYLNEHIKKMRDMGRTAFFGLSKTNGDRNAFLKLMDQAYVDELQKCLPLGLKPDDGLNANSKLFDWLEKVRMRVNEYRDRASVLLRAIQLILCDIPADVVQEVDPFRNLLNQFQHGRKRNLATSTVIALVQDSQKSLHHFLDEDQMERMVTLALIEGHGQLYGRELQSEVEMPLWVRDLLYNISKGHYAKLLKSPDTGLLGFALQSIPTSTRDAPQAEGEGIPEQSVETIDIKGKGRLVSSEDSNDLELTAGQTSVSHSVNSESTSRQSPAMAGQCSPSLAKSVSAAGPSSASTIRPRRVSPAQERASALHSLSLARSLTQAATQSERDLTREERWFFKNYI